MDEYKESEASKLIKRLMDEEGFTFGEAVKEAMRQEKEFEKKADGGSIGIEVLFGPKREDFRIGGRARPTDRVYDPRANVEDFTKALKSVSAGTTYQQQADAQRYARNKANEMLTSAMRSGNQSGIQSIFQGVGGPASMAGMQFNRSGNRITSVPATGPGRDKIINAMAQQMLNYTPSYQSLKPQPRDNLGLLMQDTIITDQMKSPAEMEAIRQKVLAAQKAQEQSYFMTDPVTGKKYSSEAEAIDDLGLVTYNQRFADGGRVGMVSGGFLKSLGKGLGSLFGKGDDAVDLAKQEEIFRTGPITKEFLETVDSKVINPFVRSRDMKGPGSYGLYESFDDMPAGLKAAELISRIKKKGGGINYEAAELFLGKKLKGNESVDELIDIMLKDSPQLEKPIDDFYNYVLNPEKKADGGRVGLFMGGPPLEGQALSIYNSMNAYGFSDQEIANALAERGLYTPGGTTEKTDIIASAPNIINQQTGGDGPPGPAPTGTKTYGKTFTGMTMPDGTPIGSLDVVQGPGIVDSLVGLYQKISPFGIVSKFMKDRAEKQETLQNNAIEKARKEREMQQAIKDAEAAQAALDNAVRTGRRPGSGSGPTTKDDGGGSAGTGGYSYDAGGREGFGYGLKKGGLATMFTRRR